MYDLELDCGCVIAEGHDCCSGCERGDCTCPGTAPECDRLPSEIHCWNAKDHDMRITKVASNGESIGAVLQCRRCFKTHVTRVDA